MTMTWLNTRWWVCALALFSVARGFCAPEDKTFLLTLLDTTGDDWIPKNEVQWNPDTDPCCDHWFLIKCDNIPTNASECTWIEQRVASLNTSVPKVNMHGNISALNFSVLQGLVTLDLSLNDLYGPVNPTIGDLPQLTALNLEFNEFSGSIPDSFANLQNLVILDLSNNGDIEGTIPSFLGDMQSLRKLDLGSNALWGEIPESLGNLTNVEILCLNNNQLTGTLVESLGGLSQLQTLSLSTNAFSGYIPADYGSLTNLVMLDLSLNDLEGPIPDSFMNLTKLQIIDLSSNYLVGDVPDALTNLCALSTMWLNANLLQGTITNLLGQLRNLTELNLSNNKISGTIPDYLATMEELLDLRLNSNNLTGTIPYMIMNFTNLQYLDLGENNLYGSVPNMIGLQSIGYVSLSSNQLTELPSQFPATGTLEHLDLSSNNFGESSQATLPPLWSFTRCRLNPKISPASIEFLDLSGMHLNMSLDDIFHSLLGGLVPSCEDVTSFARLKILNMASVANVPGPVPSRIFQLFSQASYMALSGNNLVGELPDIRAVDFPGNLQRLDFSYNSLAGPLPDYFESVIGVTLYSLYLNNNNMTSPDGTLPSYLTTSWFAAVYALNYSCPRVTDQASQRASVILDPSYFNYIFCNCSAGLYGLASDCQELSGLCLGTVAINSDFSAPAAAGACVVQTQSFNNAVQYLPGFWPTPNANASLGFLPCPSLSGTYSACLGNCSCGAFNGILDCSQCVLCAPGYQGRLCTECVPGYYLGGYATCYTCGHQSDGHSYLFGLSLFLPFLLVLILVLLRLGEDDAFYLLGKRDVVRTRPPVICGMPPSVVTLVTATFLSAGALVALSLTGVTRTWETAQLGVVLLTCIIFLAAWMRPDRRTMERYGKRSADSLMSHLGDTSGIIKSFYIYVQTIAIILPSTGLFTQEGTNQSASGPSAAFTTALAIANLEPVGLECQLRDYSIVAQTAVNLSRPILLVVASLVVAGLRVMVIGHRTQACCKGNVNVFEGALTDLWVQTESAIMFLFNFLLAGLTTSALQVFNCPQDPTPGSVHYFNDVNPWLECYSTDWFKLAIISAFFIALYCVIVIFVTRKLYLRRDHLTEVHVIAAYGFLFQSYRPTVWWYDIIFLVRRILISVSSTIISVASIYRPLAIFIILIISLIIQVHLRPFARMRANAAETVGLLAALLSYSTVVTAQGFAFIGGMTPTEITSLKSLVIAMNSFAMAGFIVATLFPFARIWARRSGRGWVRRCAARCCRKPAGVNALEGDPNDPDRERKTRAMSIGASTMISGADTFIDPYATWAGPSSHPASLNAGQEEGELAPLAERENDFDEPDYFSELRRTITDPEQQQALVSGDGLVLRQNSALLGPESELNKLRMRARELQRELAEYDVRPGQRT